MIHEIEVQRLDPDKNEFRNIDLSRIQYNGEAIVVAGKIRILVNKEVVYPRSS